MWVSDWILLVAKVTFCTSVWVFLVSFVFFLVHWNTGTVAASVNRIGGGIPGRTCLL